MTADTLGGVWTHALDLASGLREEGVEVVLATMGRPLDANQTAQAAALDNVTLHESAFRLEWMEDPWEDIEQAGRWLLDLEQRCQPDLVHLNQFSFGSLPWRAPVLVAAHSCVYSWFAAVRGEDPPARQWKRYRQAVKRGLASAGLVTAPTAAMLRELSLHYGPCREADPVPNGRRVSDFPPGSGEPFILAAGRLWDDAKNIRSLVAVAPRLAWPVYVAGEARHPDGGEVDFPGVRALGALPPKKLAGWMKRASIYALPACYEPFGLTILEAALANCALVLGDIPSLRELWTGAAVFVPPGEPAALQRALVELIEEAPRRRRLAARARARALLYTVERMTSSYLRLYRRLLSPVSVLPAPVELAEAV